MKRVLLLCTLFFSGVTSASEHTSQSTVETIISEFVIVSIRRPIPGGTLSTQTLERLAATEEREASYYGKDAFWRDTLRQRKEEEALNIIKRLEK